MTDIQSHREATRATVKCENDALTGRVKHIRAAIDALRVERDQVTELRALGVPASYGRRSCVVSGVFDDAERLVAAACEVEARGARGVYVTLNPLDRALLCWSDNQLIDAPEHAAADRHINHRDWLLFDFDPVRPAETSATDAELVRARNRALDAAEWLRGDLCDDPTVWAFSGNGFHLLFRISLTNDERSLRVVQRILNRAADRFDDRYVKVDRTVANAARIGKLYGTLARKGYSVPRIGRIHRRSCLLGKGFEL